MIIDDGFDVAAPVELLRPNGTWERIDVPHARAGGGPDHILGLEHLADCLDSGAEQRRCAEHAIHVIEIVEKAAQSSRDGRACAVSSDVGRHT